MKMILPVAVLLILNPRCFARSPAETVDRYYANARSNDIEEAKKLLASYEWTKAKRFPKNPDAGIAWIRKHNLVPKVYAEKMRGRFAMVVVRFDDLPNERIPEVALELLVMEDSQWRLLPTSRPYIDGRDLDESPEDRADIRHLEKWYFQKKKELLGYTHKPKRLQPEDEIFTRERIADVAYVSKRLSAGLDPGIQNDTFTNHDFLIHYAVRHNAIDTVRVLVRHGADVNMLSAGLSKTPLFFAAANGNVEMIELLIASGADANAVDIFDNNALREAIILGHASAIRALLNAKVDASQKNVDGITMKQLAEKYGTDEIKALFK